MKNNIKNFLIVTCSVLLGIIIYSCTDDSEDYLKYVKDGEILYIGKLDSLKVYSGHNRAQIVGDLPSDPKATEVRIYWNNMRDSVVVPMSSSGGSEEFSTIIDGLEENIYSFQVRTFDDNGNKSVVSTVTGNVYGDGYIATLLNRPILSSSPSDDGLEIIFDQVDLSTGILGTEIIYTSTDGTEKTIFEDVSVSDPVILDYEIGTPIRYRTAYIPNETAIDTFYTGYDSVTPKPTPTLKNATQPFISEAGQSGRWRNLAAPWITNDAAKSHGGVGGYDDGCCGDPVSNQSMNLECGWGQPAFTNAKIYQTTTADANKTYRLSVNIGSTNYSGDSYFVIAIGEGIPDVENVTTAPEVVAYHLINGGGTITIDFLLPEISKISVGQVSTQSGDRFCNIRSWEIIEI